jgi:hypothetical protein
MLTAQRSRHEAEGSKNRAPVLKAFACGAVGLLLWPVSLGQDSPDRGKRPLPCSLASQRQQLPKPRDEWEHFFTRPTLVETISETPKIDRVTTGWFEIDAFRCIYLPCGQVRYPGPIEFEKTFERQLCWTVSGSGEFTTKAGLIASLFARLGVTVTIGGSVTGCEKEITRILVPVAPEQCFRRYLREVWYEGSCTGKVIETTVYRWVNTRTSEIRETTCRIEVAKGNTTTKNDYSI